MSVYIPENYDPVLTVRETQEAIKFIRDLFQKEFGKQMNLERVSAPLFVSRNSGLNDNLNGVERPVSFDMLSIPGETIEVVQSLAKWKRYALGEYGYKPGEGIYTSAGTKSWTTCTPATWTSGTGSASSGRRTATERPWRIRCAASI